MSVEHVDDEARVGEHWDVAAFDLIGRGARVLSSAYAALCRNAFSLASSSEYCLRSTSAPLVQQERINQCNRTLPRCRWRCEQVTPGIAPCASDFVVLQFPFIVLGTIERNRLALARSADGFPSGRAFFDLGKNRIAHVARPTINHLAHPLQPRSIAAAWLALMARCFGSVFGSVNSATRDKFGTACFSNSNCFPLRSTVMSEWPVALPPVRRGKHCYKDLRSTVVRSR